MENLRFEIKGSRDFYEQLILDYSDYKENPVSSRLALTCAMKAWHLIDWVYYEQYGGKEAIKSLGGLQKLFKRRCPSLQIMHDLCNGTKHCRLKSHKPKVQNSELHKGGFDLAFSRVFDVSSLDIIMKDGAKKYFQDELKLVMDFWAKYFSKNKA